MKLSEGKLLQGRKYKILKTLGQGGFGITYLGEQAGLGRKVAIKEFFMREYCERDKDTSHSSCANILVVAFTNFSPLRAGYQIFFLHL